ncbi:MAG: methyl-accepting chemotaxis protein [Rhabdaerophilum sp.]
MRLKLMHKLFLPVLLLALVAVALALTGNIFLGRINQSSDRALTANEKALQASEIRALSRAIQRDTLNIILTASPDDRNAFARSIDQRIEQMKSAVSRLLPILNDTDRRDLGAFAQTQNEVIQSLLNVRALAVSGDVQRAYMLFATTTRDKERAASRLIDPFIANNMQAAEHLRHSVDADVGDALLISILAAVLGIVSALGVALAIIIWGVVRPLKGMTHSMTRLAQGHWDTEVPLTTRQDEIGGMARALLVFKENGILTERMRQEAEHEQLERERRRLALEQSVAEFDANAGMVMAAVVSASGELQAAAESLASSAEETTHQSTCVSRAAEEATANVQSVAAAGDQLSVSIGEILRQAQQSSETATAAVAAANETDSKVQELAAAAEKIGSVVEMIQSIASQTNLLALNATIEAARAGDAGRGFAVVATEVKELATQTTRATNEISSMVAGIQGVTNETIASIQTISRKIESIHVVAGVIAQSVEEQGRATSEIARSVQQAAMGTNEVSSSIAHVNDAAANTGAASAQVMSSASDLAQQSELLRVEMDKFLLAARAA